MSTYIFKCHFLLTVLQLSVVDSMKPTGFVRIITINNKRALVVSQYTKMSSSAEQQAKYWEECRLHAIRGMSLEGIFLSISFTSGMIWMKIGRGTAVSSNPVEVSVPPTSGGKTTFSSSIPHIATVTPLHQFSPNPGNLCRHDIETSTILWNFSVKVMLSPKQQK